MNVSVYERFGLRTFRFTNVSVYECFCLRTFCLLFRETWPPSVCHCTVHGMWNRFSWQIVFKWQRDSNVEWRHVIWSGLIDCMKLDISESLEHASCCCKNCRYNLIGMRQWRTNKLFIWMVIQQPPGHYIFTANNTFETCELVTFVNDIINPKFHSRQNQEEI
jgi:hypothetical protein